MGIVAIRGAITLDEDTAAEVNKRTQELVTELFAANHLDPQRVISMIFTATPDVTSAFPASAVREMGYTDIPLLNARELSVKNSLPLCVRVLVHVDTDLVDRKPKHTFLRYAKNLRPDLDGDAPPSPPPTDGASAPGTSDG